MRGLPPGPRRDPRGPPSRTARRRGRAPRSSACRCRRRQLPSRAARSAPCRGRCCRGSRQRRPPDGTRSARRASAPRARRSGWPSARRGRTSHSVRPDDPCAPCPCGGAGPARRARPGRRRRAPARPAGAAQPGCGHRAGQPGAVRRCGCPRPRACYHPYRDPRDVAAGRVRPHPRRPPPLRALRARWGRAGPEPASSRRSAACAVPTPARLPRPTGACPRSGGRAARGCGRRRVRSAHAPRRSPQPAHVRRVQQPCRWTRRCLRVRSQRPLGRPPDRPGRDRLAGGCSPSAPRVARRLHPRNPRHPRHRLLRPRSPNASRRRPQWPIGPAAGVARRPARGRRDRHPQPMRSPGGPGQVLPRRDRLHAPPGRSGPRRPEERPFQLS